MSRSVFEVSKKWIIIGFCVQIIIILLGGLIIRTARTHLLSVPITVVAAPDEGIQGYRIPIVLYDRFQPSEMAIKAQHLVPSLFNDRGIPQPFLWGKNQVPGKSFSFSFPVTLQRGQRSSYYLEWVPASAAPELPLQELFQEYSGSEGENVSLWNLENVDQDNGIFPYEGDTMLRLTITPAPVEGDHYTNDIIQLRPFEPSEIHEQSYLSYSLYYPQPSNLRVTVQARIGPKTTEMNSDTDHNGIPCQWFSPLDHVAVGRWYYRIIPLAQYAGSTIESFHLFTNDDPPLSAEELKSPIVVYIDGITLFSGSVPDILISNPLREFFRAVVSTPVFLLFLSSIVFWLIWLPLFWLPYFN